MTDSTPEQQAALDRLSAEYDRRLACLREPGAGEKLVAMGREPAELNGQVRAGQPYSKQQAFAEVAAECEKDLAWLKEPDAAAKLQAMMDDPGDLDGNAIAGKSY